MAVPSNLEWSLPVPSVQELAREPLDSVPPRYVRDDVEDPVSNPCNPSLQIPLLDMASLVNGGSQAELLHLYIACRDWGAFQLLNHGLSDESMEKMKEQIRGFFQLPLQEKKLYAQRKGSLEGYGQAFVISEDQKLEWCDMIFLKTLPIQNRNFNFWPEHPQRFRGALESYSAEMRSLAVSLLGFMAMSLGLKAHEFSRGFEQGKYDVRMNCYPQCPQPERAIGISPHADNSGITLLLNCDDIPGLQFRKAGTWVPVKPIPGAIVVNIGHILEIMSNGIFKSPEHRAVVHNFERLSIVTFCYPNENAEIGPSQNLIKPENPALYKTLSHAEYFHRFYNQKLDGDRFIDTLKVGAVP